MADTYTLISSSTLGSTTASVTFSSIPSTYTDLVVKCSARTTNGSYSYLAIQFNGNTSSIYNGIMLYSNSSGSISGASTANTSFDNGNIVTRANGSNSPSGTFSNTEIYIPNYNSSANKPYTTQGAITNNSTTNIFLAELVNIFKSTSPITSLSLYAYSADSFVAGSSFYLYGIKNS